MKIAVKVYSYTLDQEVFLGYKTDTFWTLSKTGSKLHHRIGDHMITNLLAILNGEAVGIRISNYDDNEYIRLNLEDSVLEEKQEFMLRRDEQGKWQTIWNRNELVHTDFKEAKKIYLSNLINKINELNYIIKDDESRTKLNLAKDSLRSVSDSI